MAMQYQQIWILRQTFEAPLQTNRDELMGDLRIYIYTHTIRESGAWPNMAKSHKKKQLGQKQHPNKWDEDLAKSSRIYPIHDAPSTWFNEPFSNSRHTFPRFCPCWSLKNNWLEEFRQTSSGVRCACLLLLSTSQPAAFRRLFRSKKRPIVVSVEKRFMRCK